MVHAEYLPVLSVDCVVTIEIAPRSHLNEPGYGCCGRCEDSSVMADRQICLVVTERPRCEIRRCRHRHLARAVTVVIQVPQVADLDQRRPLDNIACVDK